jgi:hypothetical protein
LGPLTPALSRCIDWGHRDIVKSFMKNGSGTYRKRRETLPLEGGGKRVGVKELRDVARAPLTLTLSPKGRGEITFDNTDIGEREFPDEN